MNQKKIIKKKKILELTPNLKNYQATYQRFEWKKAEKELQWFPGKKLNAALNAIDHQAKRKSRNKVALYWHGSQDEKRKYTFTDLVTLSNKFANVLKQFQVRRGDRVFFSYPELQNCIMVFWAL